MFYSLIKPKEENFESLNIFELSTNLLIVNFLNKIVLKPVLTCLNDVLLTFEQVLYKEMFFLYQEDLKKRY